MISSHNISQKTYQRIIQLELNEISKKAIDDLITQKQLPHFATMNRDWCYYETTSESQYEHLEPWIQWITAHTGKSFHEHRIFRLSDAIHLQHPQIWETLSKHHIESCIIGSMNAIRGKANQGFFFPDPWSKDGVTYPVGIQPLWDLISKKIHSHATQKITLTDLLQGFHICRRFKLPIHLYQTIAKQFILQKKDPMTKWKLAGIFDQFLMAIFTTLLKNKSYRYYTLFLNSVAHYQHHYWRNFQRAYFNPMIHTPDCRPEQDPMTYGYQLYDNMIGTVLKLAEDPHTLVIVASGLSQAPYLQKENQGGMNYYRLYNHTALMEKLDLHDYRVLPMMSRDWQIVANHPEKLSRAAQRLSGLRAAGQPIFTLTNNTEHSLFIETAITDKIDPTSPLYDAVGQSLGAFKDYFHHIAVKSGHHIGTGSVWFSQPVFSQTTTTLPLTALYSMTLRAFGINPPDGDIPTPQTKTFVPPPSLKSSPSIVQ